MNSTSYSISIGTVIYNTFPTYSELNKLRNDAIEGMMIFFRMLGLCSIRQINAAIGNPEDDYRIKWMLTHSGVADMVDESQSIENQSITEELQREILGDDDHTYIVEVTEIATMLQKVGYFKNCRKALEDLLRQKQNERLGKPMSAKSKTVKSTKYTKSAAKPVTVPETKPEVVPDAVPEAKLVAAVDIVPEAKPTVVLENPPESENAITTPKLEELKGRLEQQVLAIKNNCPFQPIKNFQEAKRTAGYFAQLVGYFPNITACEISTYLFDGQIGKHSVLIALREAGLSRGRGFKPGPESLIERCGFVAWTGAKWQDYYECAAKPEPAPVVISVKPKPEPPKKPKATAKTEKSAADKPKGKTSQSSRPLAQASITISGTVAKILFTLSQIEVGGEVDLLEFHVKK